ncbi:hypothetical protein KI387_006848, partial [Taxus chinensis]
DRGQESTSGYPWRGYTGRWGYDRTSHLPFPQYRREDVEAPLPAPQPVDPDWVVERPA